MTNPTAADYQCAKEELEKLGWKFSAEYFWNHYVEIIRSALTLAASDTHVWVPREPTESMLKQSLMGWHGTASSCENRSAKIYKAMITAAEGTVDNVD